MEKKTGFLELYAGAALLGILENIEMIDWPWHKADFKPTAVFETHRQLFEAEYRLWAEKNGEQHSLYEKIAQIKLRLVSSELPITAKGLLFHTNGKQAQFRAMFVSTSS